MMTLRANREFPKPTRHILRDDRGAAFVEFALIVPLLITMIMVGTEFSNATQRHSRLSLCTLMASKNYTAMGWSNAENETAIGEQFRTCIGENLAANNDNGDPFTRARIVCIWRKPQYDGLTSAATGELFGTHSNQQDTNIAAFGINLMTTPPSALSQDEYDLFDDTNNNRGEGWVNNFFNPAGTLQTRADLPVDFLAHNDGRCVAQACASSDPIVLRMLSTQAVDRLFGLISQPYCISHWSQGTRTLRQYSQLDLDRLYVPVPDQRQFGDGAFPRGQSTTADWSDVTFY